MGVLGKALVGVIAAVAGVALLNKFAARMSPAMPNVRPVVKGVSALHRTLYRSSGGRLGRRFADAPVLLLTTIGRKTGLRRTTPLFYLEDGDNLVVAGSNGGDDRHPAWFLNLRDQPYVELQVGEHSVRAKAEVATPEEKRRLWPRFAEMYAGYETYRQRTEREIPVVILRPVETAGLKD